MTEKPDLAALVGSRICHDLISPVGAINNGVELMMLDGSTLGPEMALIAESVANASARIRFFRIAFGQTSVDQRIGRTEVVSVLDDLAQGGRVLIDWQGPTDLLRRDVKLIFLLVLCLESALPYGGQITISRVDTRWLVVGTSPKLKLDTELWQCLVDPAGNPHIGPAQVQFLLAPEEVARQHRRLTTELGTDSISVSF